MGAEQWERIRSQMKKFGKGTHVNIQPALLSSLDSRPMQELNGVDTHVLWHMLFFRQNARTRFEIAQREHAWRKKHPKWPTTRGTSPCVAIHVRHGDKLTPFWIK